MRESEQIALQYLVKKGYKQEDIDFNGRRTIDFIYSNGEQIEVKTLKNKRTISFTPNQLRDFQNSVIKILVVQNKKVIDVFPFSKLEKYGYDAIRLGEQEFSTVSLPLAMLKRIDELCEQWGYSSRSDFVRDAVRRRFTEIQEETAR